MHKIQGRGGYKNKKDDDRVVTVIMGLDNRMRDGQREDEERHWWEEDGDDEETVERVTIPLELSSRGSVLVSLTSAGRLLAAPGQALLANPAL